MGGKGGHMLHPYEDPELTFQSLINMFEHTAMGGLEGTIKRDGQNLVLSFSLLRDEAVAIRNDDHVFAKGMGLKGEGPKENFADYLAARSLWVVLTTPNGKKEEFTTERKWEKYLKENGTSPEALEAAGYSVEMIGRGWKSFRNGVSREKKATPRHIIEAFSKAMRDLENVAREMPKELIIKLFGEDADYFYNAEVMSPLSRNAIEYGVDTLSTHRILHHKYDEEEKELDTMGAIDSGKRAELFDRALKDYYETKGESGDERNPTPVSVGALERLAALEDDSIKEKAINEVAQLASVNNLSLNDSLGRLVFVRFREAVAKALPSIGPEAEKLLVIRMFQEVYNSPGHEWGVDEVLKEFGNPNITEGKVALTTILGASADREPQVAATVKEIAGSAKRFHNRIIAPLVNIIFTFSAHALGALEDLYVLNRDVEIERTRSTVLKTIKNLETLLHPVKSSDPRADEKWEKFLAQRDKFKALEDKISEAEGFVFQWPPGSDNTYKFTGLFAPINQLLGMDPSRWAEGLIYTETLLTEQEAQEDLAVAYFPGGFKPPHRGHLKTAVEAIKTDPNTHLIIMTGESKRDEITLEKATQVLAKYLEREGISMGVGKGQVEVKAIKPVPIFDETGKQRVRTNKETGKQELATTTSPITAIMYEIEKLPQGATAYAVASEADPVNAVTIVDYAARKRPDLNIQPIIVPVEEMGGFAKMSATQMRKAVQENDFETFKLFLPASYNDDEEGAQEIFAMLGGGLEETVVTMGGGAVSGPGARGPGPRRKKQTEEGVLQKVGKMTKKAVDPVMSQISSGLSVGRKEDEEDEEEKLVNEVADYLLGISVG